MSHGARRIGQIRWLERIEREGRLVSTSHFPEPFGTFQRDGDRRLCGSQA